MLRRSDLLVEDLVVYKHAAVAIYYAPFDYVNTSARILIAGITPGWQQMEIACRVARAVLLSGATPEIAERTAKLHAKFCWSNASRK